MKHIKKFTETNTINEYYGGTLNDLMNPRAEEVIKFLRNYIETENPSKEDNQKVEQMFRLLNP